MGKDVDIDVDKILAERFGLTLEQAKNLHFAYRLGGSCEENVVVVYQMYDFKISIEVIRQVFYSLDDLGRIIKEGNDLMKWWKTDEM